jgi:hypothetical protein
MAWDQEVQHEAASMGVKAEQDRGGVAATAAPGLIILCAGPGGQPQSGHLQRLPCHSPVDGVDTIHQKVDVILVELPACVWCVACRMSDVAGAGQVHWS